MNFLRKPSTKANKKFLF